MNALDALLLGFIEGLTEYLPVSSTGHLILAAHWLGKDDEASHAFEIIIQLGALCAVLVHYRHLLKKRISGLFARDPQSINLALALAVAFIPTALLGLLLRKAIKQFLFGPTPVAAALIVGGVVMIVLSLLLNRRYRASATQYKMTEHVEEVTCKQALTIGFGQCFALWPGASRSMCTILAGELVGLRATVAAEFSFLLALPTLGSATLYELWKSRHSVFAIEGSSMAIAIGLLVSFLVGWASIAAFLRYLTRFGLIPFGVYRVVIGVLVFVLLAH